MRRWRLFIDESGDFDTDTSIVVGVLVEQPAPSWEPARLRRALEAAAPGVPWPIHGWLTRRFGMYLLWDLLEAERSGAATAESLRVCVRSCEKVRDEALERLRSGREPSRQTIDAIEDAIKDAGEMHAFAGRRIATLEGIGRVLDAATAAGEVALVFAALAEAPAESKDPYLHTLTTGLERAVDALAALPGSHEVRVHALGRHVLDPDLGANTPLHVRHVAACAGEAVAAAGLGRVRLVPERVAVYDIDVHPALVVADLLANRARRLVKDRGLVDLEGRIARTLRVPVRAAGLPLAAATGAPRVAVADARGGGAAAADDARAHLDAAPPPWRWAREQAEAWIDHFGGAS